jgi:hypothetical protein
MVLPHIHVCKLGKGPGPHPHFSQLQNEFFCTVQFIYLKKWGKAAEIGLKARNRLQPIVKYIEKTLLYRSKRNVFYYGGVIIITL